MESDSKGLDVPFQTTSIDAKESSLAEQSFSIDRLGPSKYQIFNHIILPSPSHLSPGTIRSLLKNQQIASVYTDGEISHPLLPNEGNYFGEDKTNQVLTVVYSLDADTGSLGDVRIFIAEAADTRKLSFEQFETEKPTYFSEAEIMSLEQVMDALEKFYPHLQRPISTPIIWPFSEFMLENNNYSQSNRIARNFSTVINSLVAEWSLQYNIPILYQANVSQEHSDSLPDEIIEAGVRSGQTFYWPKETTHRFLQAPHTRITAPERDIVSLINMSQITAYLKGQHTPFTIDDLKKLAITINGIKVEDRAYDDLEQHNLALFYIAQIAKNKKNFNQYTENQFGAIFRAGLRENIDNPWIIKECEDRYSKGKWPTPEDVYHFLFNAKNPPAYLQPIIQMIDQKLSQDASLNILGYCTRRLGVDYNKSQIKNLGEWQTIIALRSNRSTARFKSKAVVGAGTNKVEANIRAAIAALNYLVESGIQE